MISALKKLTTRYSLPFLLLPLILIGTFYVYKAGLGGAYIFDDGPNIVNNASIAIHDLHADTLKKAALSTASGPLRRPISMLSFALNYYYTGLNPYYFKLTNLGIHLLNGLGIFVASLMLLGIYRKRFEPALSKEYTNWISLAVTGAWLLHPFNLTSVLYVVQRMNSLSALFTIWGLVFYLWGRTQSFEGKKGIPSILIGIFLFTPLATLSKENGMLLPIFMLIAEFAFFGFHTEDLWARRFLKGLFIITVALPAIAVLIYFAMDINRLTGGYADRGFTLSERIMTETRVLWFYMRSIILPSIAKMGIFHDDIPLSHGLLQPISTLFSSLGLIAILYLSFIARKKAPILTFGILFFLAGHLLESSVIALEITHEHRNYLPMFGLLLPLFFYILYPLRFTANLHIRQVAAILLIGLFGFSTFARASKWANPFDLVQNEVMHHPNSPRTNGEMANVYATMETTDKIILENNYQFARFYYEKAVELDDNYTNGLFGLIIFSSDRDKPVEHEWVVKLIQRLKHSAYSPDNGSYLIKLVECQFKNVCKLPKNEIEEILQAPFENPTLTNRNRALALSAWGLYLVNIAQDYPAALATMYKTIELEPQELEYRATLIKFLVALQRKGEAAVQITALKQLDKMQLYKDEMKSQSKLLDSIK